MYFNFELTVFDDGMLNKFKEIVNTRILGLS